ncbi:MAG TPA: magnesium transporter [Kofleriaceae bacterium]|jgi:magnesium transporter
MSAGLEVDTPKSAVPLADLSVIDRALAGGDEAALREAVAHVRPADLGRDLSRRSSEETRRLFGAIEERRGAAMLRAAHPAVAGQLLADVPADRAARVFGFLPTDHQVEVLSHVAPECRARIEAALPTDEREVIARHLAFPPIAVGRLMTPKVWRAQRTATAGEAMAHLAANRADIEIAANLYLLDGELLVGVAALREVAIAKPDAALAELMTPAPLAVREDAPRSDAAEIIRTHDFLSLPVIDRDGKLVGAVRVDDVLDAVLERVGDAFLNQGAVAGTVASQAPYFRTPIARTVRSRLTWLLLLFVAETATGTVLRYFEGELARVVALSFFVPLLIGTGGNAGSQTVATVIRAAALGEVRPRDAWRVIAREVSAGVLLGLLLAAIAFGRALLWGVGTELALCVSITIFVVVTWANTVGAGIPLAAQRLGIDPTVISGPLITTLVDATGLFIYFTVAHLTISQLHEPVRPTTTYTCVVSDGGQPIPACPGGNPCWSQDAPAEDAPASAPLAIKIDRGGAPSPAGASITATCSAK